MAKLSKKKVVLAIEGTGAIMSVIAKRLNVARQYIYEYFNKHPDLKKYLDAEEERTIDEYEEVLKMIATEGALRDSTTLGAVKYYLNNKARRRGFAERQEIQHSGDAVTKVKLIIIDERDRNEDKSSNEDTEQE